VEKAEDREGVYDGLRKIRREARSGADFDALGLAHTDKEDKLVDLGWFGRGEFSDEFDLILFSLEIGEVSPVFASHWGFHLAKVTGRENPEPRPFEEVREEVRQRYLAELRQEKTREYVEELKKAALIEEIAEE
jgi:parvulin-like peptidyl-prolyl isomerase